MRQIIIEWMMLLKRIFSVFVSACAVLSGLLWSILPAETQTPPLLTPIPTSITTALPALTRALTLTATPFAQASTTPSQIPTLTPTSTAWLTETLVSSRIETVEAVLTSLITPSATVSPTITPTATATEIPRTFVFTAYDLSFSWEVRDGLNAYSDIDLQVTFTSPTGESMSVGGFFYSLNEYRVRVLPTQVGRWQWRAAITDGVEHEAYDGSFIVLDTDTRGGIQPNPSNPMRWVYDDGTPYYPIGLSDCVRDSNRDGDFFNDFGFDAQPNTVNLETYLFAHGSAGFNLFRFSNGNCMPYLYQVVSAEGNQFCGPCGRTVDTLFERLRQYGFHIYMDIFGFVPPYADDASAFDDPLKVESIRAAVRYAVNRYGAYVDFWEIMNEATPVDDRYYTLVIDAIRDSDPYQHPISTSWERPELELFDVISPHWYERENELASDAATLDQITPLRRYNRPIIFGEQGNAFQNWDERSGLRMRIRAWTALFNEAALIFWNTSYDRNYQNSGAANVYIGVEERHSINILQDFATRLDADITMFEPIRSVPEQVRAYGLESELVIAVYLHHYADHTTPVDEVTLMLDMPFAGLATWIDPESGAIAAQHEVESGMQVVTAPAFMVDMALIITLYR